MKTWGLIWGMVLTMLVGTVWGQSVSNTTPVVWTDDSHWTPAVSPAYNTVTSATLSLGHTTALTVPLQVNTGNVITIKGTVTTNKNIIVRNGGQLIIDGDVECAREVRLDDGATVVVNGKLELTGTQDLNVANATFVVNTGGTVTIDADANFTSAGASITIDGNLQVGGAFTNAATVTGTGTAKADSTFDNTGTIFGCTDGGFACCQGPFCSLSAAVLGGFPGWTWAEHAITPDFDFAFSIALDTLSLESGVYIGGSFEGDLSADYGDGSGTTRDFSSVTGIEDAFVARYDTDGNFEWALKIEGPGATRVHDVVVGPFGNVYATGYFNGTTEFQGIQPDGSTTLAAGTQQEAFIASYTPGGLLRWVRQAASSAATEGSSIAADATAIYATGFYSAALTVGASSLSAPTSQEGYVVKLDTAGTVVWLEDIFSDNEDEPTGIATDGTNVYVCGNTEGKEVSINQGATTVSTGVLNCAGCGTTDPFLVCMRAADGQPAWARMIDGKDAANDIVNDVAVGGGFLYVTGELGQSGNFSGAVDTLVANASTNNSFVSQHLRSDGGVVWVSLHDNSAVSHGVGTAIAANPSGNAVAVGYLNGTTDFAGTSIASYGLGTDIYVVKYLSNGFLEYVEQAGDNSSDFPWGVAMLDDSSVYVCGSYSQDSDFGSINLSSGNSSDNIFLAKIGDECTGTATAITGNTASHSGSVCAGETPDPVVGSAPGGGDGSTYAYLWQQSTDDGTTWTNIASATSQGYTPGVLADTTHFRRIVSSCEQLDTSAAIVVNVVAGASAGTLTVPSQAISGVAFSVVSTDYAGLLQWQTSPDSAAWVDAAGATSASDALTATSDTYVRLIASLVGCNSDTVANPIVTILSDGWAWATAHGTGGTEIGNHIALDTANELVYVVGVLDSAGAFPGLVASNFNDGDGEGFNDGFLAQYNYAGSLQWVTIMGGSNDDELANVAVGPSGNVYVTGCYYEDCRIYNATSGSTTLGNGSSTFEVLTACFNSSGELQWAQDAVGAGEDKGHAITTTDEGVFVTGVYEDFITFGAHSTNATYSTRLNVFVVHYDFTTGTPQWLGEAKSNRDDDSGKPLQDFSMDITAHEDSVYVIGLMAGTNMRFADGSGTLDALTLSNASAPLKENLFIASWEVDGDFRWAAKIEQDGAALYGTGIAADAAGVYVTGNTANASVFPGGTTLATGDTDNPFLARLSHSDGTEDWVTTWGTTSSSTDVGHDVATDGNGNVYVVGRFVSDPFFGPDSSLTGTTSMDMFLARYSSAGAFMDVEMMSGAGTDYAYGLAVDADSNVFVTGSFAQTVSFDGLAITSTAADNLFVGRKVVVPAPPCGATPTAGPGATYCSGDALGNMTAVAPTAGTLTWYSDAGLTTTIGTGATQAPANVTGVSKYYVTETVGGCESTADSVTITINALPTIDSGVRTNITTCGATDGTITITASGGTPAIQYSIDGGGALAGSGSFTGLAVGNYDLYIEDANFCGVDGATLTIAEPATPAAPVAGTNSTYCSGDAIANMTAVASAGGTLTWYDDGGGASIGTGTTQAPVNTIGTEVYYVTEIASGCESDSSAVTITINAVPSLDSEARTNTTACGADDGTITITASGGSAPIQYSIDGGGTLAGAGNFTALVPGSYDVYIEDANGCAVDGSTLVVADPASPVAPVAGTNSTYCSGDALANMTAVAAVGGTLTWYDDGGGASIGTGTTQAPANTVGTEVYYVTETLAGCESDSSTVTITINALPSLDSEARTNTTGCGADDGTITITASGGAAPIQYSIDGGGTLAGAGNFTALAPGNYDVYIEDANGCSVAGSTLNIADPATPAVPVAGTNAMYCSGDALANMTAVAAAGGTLTWYDNSGGASIGTGTTQAPANTVGTELYYVTETVTGCESDSATVTITINALPSLDSEARTNTTACGADDGTITITASGGAAPIQYSIDGGGTLAGAGNFTALAPGNYDVYIEDANGCSVAGSTLTIADPATPAVPVAGTNAMYCSGDALANMTAVAAAGGTLTWYDNSGGASIGTGITQAPANTVGTELYYVTETVTGCESDSATVTITINALPSLDSEARTNTTACGADDGTITITASGGAAPIQYSIDGGGTLAGAGNFTALAPGNYDVYIEDANGCSVAGSTLNIADPATPAVPVAGTNAMYCSGDALANMTAVAAAGGTLTWYDNSGGASIGAGTTQAPANTIGTELYHVTETVAGCESDSATVTITINALPSLDSEARTNTTACGADDGTITITASGGAAPIQYSIDGGGTLAGAGNFTALAPGNYDVYIEDANGCSVAGSTLTIADPATPAAPVAGTNASYCSGAALANMTAVAAAGGTLTWYDDGGGASIGTGTTQAPANTVGTEVYYVTETAAGCESDSTSVTITINALPSLDSESRTNTTACAADDGTITITASGGAAPIQYSIDGGGTLAGSGNFTALAPGNYDVYIEDANGCSVAGSTLTIADPATPAAPVAGTNASYCSGAALANMTAVAAAGGTLTWYDDGGGASIGTGTTQAPANTIGTEVYYVTETAAGCESDSTSVTITINALPSLDSESRTNTTACAADDGTITITASGGAAPIQYSIDGGGTLAGAGNFTGLAPGNYDVYIEDANGCSVAGSTLTIADPATPAAPVAGTNASYCSGAALANMTAVAAAGGTLTWYDNSGGASIGTGTTQAPANTIGTELYYVTETVAGCESDSATVTITINALPSLDSESRTNTTACGADDGTITITASGGAAPIQYSIDGGGTLAGSGNFTALAPGNYDVYIEDANGCSVAGSTLTVADPATPAAPVAGTNASYCSGAALANMSAVAAAGGTLTWYDNSGGASIGTGTTQAPANTIGTEVYYVTETAAGCESDSTSVTITINALPSLDSESRTNTTACGADDGTITITASGGAAPIQYSIDGGGTLAGAGNFTALAPGSYDIYIEDANGCSVAGSTLTIADPATPAAPVAGTNASYCSGAALANMTAVAAAGGTLTWYDNSGGASIGTGTTQAPANTVGTEVYYVTETVASCESDSATVTITINALPSLDSEARTNTTACGADDGTITITASGGAPPIQYSIDGGGTLAGSGNFTALATGNYDVYIEDANGCSVAGSTLTIADPATPAAPVAGTNASYCSGAALANMTAVAAAGGTLTWYDNSGGASIGTGTTQAPANTIGTEVYYVTETAAGCESDSTSVTITINALPSLDSESRTNTTACGADDGTITITASGGAAPIQYSIDGGGTLAGSGNFTALPPGNYDVYIEDANGCSVNGSTLVVADPTAPAAPVAGTNASYCSGAALANMTAVAGSGGTLTWYDNSGGASIGTGTTQAPANTIGTETYYVTETVASCESDSTTVTITINPVPTIDSEAKTDLNSCGGNDGTITITASGGTPAIQYSIDGGGTLAGSGSFTGLAPGSYDVYIEDANNCSATGATLAIANPPTPATPVAGAGATYCEGSALANMTATAGSGGTLTWYDNSGGASIGTGSTQAPANTVGTEVYYVTETVAGCESDSASVSITIHSSPGIDSEAQSNITACGADDGTITITITASGGTAPIMYSIDGGGTLAGSGVFTGLAPGNYDVYIEDANNCSVTGTTIPITEPTTPAAPVVGAGATYCDGAVIANMTAVPAVGGTLTWYDDNGGASIGSGTSQAPVNTIGTEVYYVTETLAGCESDSASVTITINPTPTIDSEASTDLTACGANDGTITLTASGGTAPIMYSIDGGGTFAAGGNFTGLVPGSYDVYIEDASTCSATGSTLPIAEPPTPAAPLAGAGATYCFGDALTNMTAIAGSGGTLTWYADGGGASIGTGLTQLPNNTVGTTIYYVSETVAACESDSAVVTIIIHPTPTIDLEANTQITMCGADDGTVTITASGGTPALMYSIDGGTSTVAGFNFTGLSPGSYELYVEDANTCTDTGSTVVIAEPPTPAAPVAGAGATYCDGAMLADMTATAGAGGTLTWYDNSGGASIGNGATQTPASTVGTEVYYVTETVAGCESDSSTVTITIHPTPTIDLESSTDLTACGANDGTITIAASGGTPAIQYSVDGGTTTGAGNSFSGLSPGNYDVYIEDANTCTDTGSTITISEPPTPVAPIVGAGATYCDGATLAPMTATAGSGGTLTWYDNSGGASIGSGTTHVPANTPGTEIYYATETLAGCESDSASVSITINPTPTIDAEANTQITACGADDGTITITASGGTPAIQYSIDGGGTLAGSGSFTGLAPGNYDVYIEDANTCTDTGTTIVIVNPPTPAAPVAGAGATYCDGATLADMTATAGSGGTLNWYDSSGGASIGSGPTQTPANTVGTEVYYVTETVAGCESDSASVTIIVNPTPTIDVEASTDIVTCGANDGTITITASGGTPALRYSINGGTTTGTAFNFTSLAAGNYDLYIEDANTCTDTGSTITISEPPTPVAPVAGAGATYCEGATLIDMTASAGSGGTLTWYDNSGGPSIGAGPTQAPANTIGTELYYVTETVAGCESDSASVTIVVHPSPTIDSDASTDFTACGANDGTITITASGGTPAIQYSIDGGATLGGSGSFTGLAAGNYDLYIQDANTCTDTGATLTISEPPTPAVPAVSAGVTYCFGASLADMTATTSAGGTLTWYDNSGGGSVGAGPSHTPANTVGTEVYYVTETLAGCESDSASVTIIINPTPTIDAEASTIISACGAADGTITITASGGTAPLNYSITGGAPTTTTFAFTGLAPNSYPIYVVDANGCDVSGNTIIMFNPGMPAPPAAEGDSVYCFGDALGNMTATAVSAGTLNWYDDSGSGIVFGTGASVAPANTTGQHTYYVTETVAGCESDSGVVVVQINALATITSETTTPISGCGANDGGITIVAAGGVGPLVFSIDSGATVQPTGIFAGLADSIYQVAVIDTSGCMVTGSAIPLNDPAPPAAPVVSADTTYCDGESIAAISATPSGAGAITWYQDENLTIVLGNGASIVPTPAVGSNTYYATETLTNCESLADSVLVVVQPALQGNTITGSQTICESGTVAALAGTGAVTGGDGSISWAWEESTDGIAFAAATGINNQPTYQPANAVGSLYFRRVASSGACVAASATISDTVQVTIDALNLAGTLSAGATLCGGDSVNMITTGAAGSFQWQQSTDAGANWSDLSGGNDTSRWVLPAVDTEIRMIASGGACAADTSAGIAIVVDAAPSAGTILGATTLCVGDSSVLQLQTSAGNIQWQASTNGGTSWSDIPLATADTLLIQPTLATSYRAVASAGVCPNDTSAAQAVSVDALPTAGTVSAPTSICAGAGTTISLTGSSGQLQWESSIDAGATWSAVSGANTASEVVSPSVSTSYRAIASNGICTPDTSAITLISVDAAPVSGTISGAATLCDGDSTVLQLLASSGSIQWQSSTNGGTNWLDIAFATADTLLIQPATDTSYRAVVSAGVCPNDTSAAHTVAVDALPIAGAVSAPTSICAGAGTTVSLTGSSGQLQWEASTDGGANWSAVSGANTASEVVAPSVSTSYRAIASNGNCTPDTSAVTLISVDAAPVAGTVSGAATLCSGDSTVLQLMASSGSVQWQSSSNGGTNWSDIAFATADTLLIQPAADTSYRAVVSSGVCPNDTSAALSVTADPQPIAGTISASTTICEGDSTTIALTGTNGTLQWESSTDGGTTWTAISGATSASEVVSPIVATTYRAIASSGTCPPDTSAITTISVDPAPVAGSVAGATTICAGDSTVLQLLASLGAIQWQASTNGGASWADIALATADTLLVQPTDTTSYRAIVSSGACLNDTTAVVTVAVDAAPTAGTISASASICSGDSATLSLTGASAQLYWEASTDGGTTWATVPAAATATEVVHPLVTTSYRAIATNGLCPADTSASTTISVDPAPVAGTISGNASLCAGDSTLLQLQGHSGTIEWQSSTNGGASWTTIALATADSLMATPLVSTNYRVVLSSGICPADTSAAILVTVDAAATAGSVTAVTNICLGDSVQLVAVGASGSLQWELSVDSGQTWTAISGATSATETRFPTAYSMYRLVATSGACAGDTSTVLPVEVSQPAVAGVIAGGGIICAGTDTTLSLDTNAGSLQWQSSLDGGLTWTDIALAQSDTLLAEPLVNTDYRVIATSGACAADTSLAVTVAVAPPSVAGQASADTAICFGSTALMNLAGNSGSVQWQQSTDSGATWADVFGATFNTLFVSPATTTWYQAAVTAGSCPTAFSNPVLVEVFAAPIGGVVSGTDTICSGDSVQLALSGALGEIQWELWDGTNWNAIPAATDSLLTIAPDSTTKYRATTSSGPCIIENSTEHWVVVTTGASGTITAPASICSGDTVSLQITADGIGPWDVVYTNGTDTLTLTANSMPLTPEVAPLATTTYTLLSISDASGCSTSLNETATIAVDTMPSAAAGFDDATCSLSYSLNADAASAGNWWSPDGAVFSNVTDPFSDVTVATPGTYPLYWIAGGASCTDSAVVNIEFTQPNDSVYAGPDQQVEVVDAIQLEALQPLNGFGSWSMESGSGSIVDPAVANTEVNGLQTGDNILRWTVANGACLEDWDEVIITVVPFTIPTGFSPNGDGINDQFVIPGLAQFMPAELIVFNRWGEQVFRIADYQNTWDGSDANGFNLPDDTYYYLLQADALSMNGFFVIKRQ